MAGGQAALGLIWAPKTNDASGILRREIGNEMFKLPQLEQSSSPGANFNSIISLLEVTAVTTSAAAGIHCLM